VKLGVYNSPGKNLENEADMKLVTLEQMREIENEAIRSGSSVEKLMELAGKGIAYFIDTVFTDSEKIITALVGTGNNGGDALVALAELAGKGWETRAILARPREDSLVQRLSQVGGTILPYDTKKKGKIIEFLEGTTLVLDGVLGAGVKLPLKKDLAEFLGSISENLPDVPVIAVDCPSGVDLESGDAAPETINADLTLSMGAVKEGLIRFPAFGLCLFQ
jgi:NAD(P)H-hydrate epimerase